MQFSFDKPLVLASASPRRRQLLGALGLPFTCAVSSAPERAPAGLEPAALVQCLAAQKSAAVAKALSAPALVLGCDTVVVRDKEILGKPQTAAEAMAMLQSLRGRSHEVFTGLCLLDSATGRQLAAFERTTVTFGEISDQELQDYVATGDPMDKAGAYAIQGGFAVYIAGINGCYYNVMGLPLHRLRKLFCQWQGL